MRFRRRPSAPLLGLLLAGLLVAPAAAQDREALLREFARHGVLVDLERGLIQLDASICQVYEPLEYLLVIRPRGKDHESLLCVEEVSAEALNAAILLLGVEAGQNGRIVPKDPPISREEYEAGVPPYEVLPAAGDGMFLYVFWEETTPGGEVEQHFHRAEDLVLNIRRERTYQRGRWVYLGSRFLRPHPDAEELFAAEATGNLVSLVYFDPPNHLLTGADPDADNQYIWYPNLYLLPPLGTGVRLLFSRERLERRPPLLEPPAPAER